MPSSPSSKQQRPSSFLGLRCLLVGTGWITAAGSRSLALGGARACCSSSGSSVFLGLLKEGGKEDVSAAAAAFAKVSGGEESRSFGRFPGDFTSCHCPCARETGA